MTGSASQSASRCLTKRPPQKLPPPSQTASSSSPLPSPARMSSFPKRHASFGSPREIPMPSPSQNNVNPTQFSYFPPMPRPEPGVLTKSRPTSLSNNITESGFSPVFDEQVDDSDWTNLSKRSPTLDVEETEPQSTTTATTVHPASHIHPYPRPYSVPQSHSDADQPQPQSLSSSQTYKSPTAVDRTSSASLPLPTQIPFHLLPKASLQGGALRTTEPDSSHKTASDSLPSDVARPGTVKHEKTESHQQSDNLKNESDDGSEHSSGSFPSVSSANPSRTTSGRSSPLCGARLEGLQKDRALRPVSYPSSQIRDPPQQSAQHTSLPYLAETSLDAATALRRSATMSANQSHISPPQPPIILPSRTNESLTSASRDTSLSTSNSATNPLQSLYPSRLPQTSMVNEPPYATFLSHAPPPADSWLEVETKPSEYRLNVRLPGFQRDGMYV